MNLKTPKDEGKLEGSLAELRLDKELRSRTYRERALKMYPWICARCGREFSGKKLRELTVHHKDHNHDNNPPDGSNWELLCLYCHDYEHTKYPEEVTPGETSPSSRQKPSSTYQPFADLDKRLQKKN
ncbi:MAG: YajD family HNH nuclease [Alphaproteobacteria bacterium]|nr:YajD family HNH nuclease [Alphaproteobacteria bacterium]